MATLREVVSGNPYINGNVPTTYMTLLVHEEGQGEDWLLHQNWYLRGPELFHLLAR